MSLWQSKNTQAASAVVGHSKQAVVQVILVQITDLKVWKGRKEGRSRWARGRREFSSAKKKWFSRALQDRLQNARALGRAHDGVRAHAGAQVPTAQAPATATTRLDDTD